MQVNACAGNKQTKQKNKQTNKQASKKKYVKKNQVGRVHKRRYIIKQTYRKTHDTNADRQTHEHKTPRATTVGAGASTWEIQKWKKQKRQPTSHPAG